MSDLAPSPPTVHAPLPTRDLSGAIQAVDGEVTVIEILSVLLRRWRLVAGLPVLVGVVTAVVSLVLPATYTATATFVPEVRSPSRLPGNVASLAGQLGLPLGVEPSQSPRFYTEVAHSRELLERLLVTRFPVPGALTGAADSATRSGCPDRP